VIKDIRDGLSFIRRQCGHVDERFHSIVMHGPDYGASICVPDQNDRPGSPLDNAPESGCVIGE
jgi:hypothetical protein